MDINFYLQSFEANVKNYDGDDPLDPWDRFVAFLECRLPSEEKSNISVVLNRLVQTFLQDKRYHNDIRFVNHCIKCASLHSDPAQVYSCVYGGGVGSRSAALYVSWAQHLEQKGLLTQALQVYEKAVENQAEPLDSVHQHCSLFQTRTAKSQMMESDQVRNPLQNSQRVNQSPQQRALSSQQCKDPETVPADTTVRIISRSENNPKASSVRVETVSMYCVKELEGDGFELCFEEVRARRYFSKLGHPEELRKREEAMRKYGEEKEEFKRMTKRLQDLNGTLSAEPDQSMLPVHLPQELLCSVSHSVQTSEQPSSAWSQAECPAPRLTPNPTPSSVSLSQRFALRAPVGSSDQTQAAPQEFPLVSKRKSECSLLWDGARHPVEPRLPAQRMTSISPQQGAALLRDAETAEIEAPTDTSYSSLPHSHVTPNTSLGLICATPSRVLPSPTVNTREALDVIMDMFQAPTLLQDTFFNSQAPDDSIEKSCRAGGLAPSVRSPSSAPFRIYQDESDEHRRVEVKAKPMAARTLMEIPVSKSVSASVNFLSDDSAVCGWSSMTTIPSVSRDFTLDTHLVSTPLHPTVLECGPRGVGGVEENPYLRQPTKLSPILEQSPPDDKPSEGAECTMRGQGTIVGEGVCLPQQSHTSSLSQPNQTSCSVSRQPLALLVFPEPTHAPSGTCRDAGAKPTWSIYQSPERTGPTGCTSDLSGKTPQPCEQLSSDCSDRQRQLSEEWTLPQDTSVVASSPKGVLRAALDVPMSPDPAPGLGPFQVESPGIPESDLDVLVRSSRSPGTAPVQLLGQPIFRSPALRLPLHSQEPTGESVRHMVPDPEQAGLLFSKRSFNRQRSEKRVLEVPSTRKSLLSDPVQDIPMSPEPALGLSWFRTDSPTHAAEPDLDVLMTSHCCPAAMPLLEPSVPQQCDMEVPLSPRQPSSATPMPPRTAPTPSQLVPNPWDEDLIASLLAGLHTPLSSSPNLTVWSHALPTVTPKMTIQMAEDSLRVDCVLGQGAFATVYQATSLTTSRKLVLKVQKPAHPWEFYISEQLNTRVDRGLRHLFAQFHSAHLFTNGSLLAGELHSCGTLLGVVNLYKYRPEKTMPQPLLLYFTVCILRVVDQLHRAGFIHADIKPDNFLLGERFLKDKVFDVEDHDHGLVLIDFGQSIDMSLFPEGTAFTASCMTSGFQCTEMLTARPWTYQTDYFGIAGTVHCMMFGSYMEVRNEDGVWKSNGLFKRSPHRELWEGFFHTLLNVPSCTTLPCLRSLCTRLSAALQENYSRKLCSLKNRLVVQILEARSSRR